MILEKLRYVAVEGPIGAGKTSLARRLASHLNSRLLLEEPDANPFLPKFYQDRARYALPTQLYFLFQRVSQIRSLAQMDLFHGLTVADFLLEKDPLFARLNLKDEEFDLYCKIYSHLNPRPPAPDLVIYLQASVETLAIRVKKRGHDYEKGLPEEYLARLAEAYSQLFHHYDCAPVLIVNSDRLNFVDRPRDFDLLLERIGEMRSAREFFNWGL